MRDSFATINNKTEEETAADMAFTDSLSARNSSTSDRKARRVMIDMIFCYYLMLEKLMPHQRTRIFARY